MAAALNRPRVPCLGVRAKEKRRGHGTESDSGARVRLGRLELGDDRRVPPISGYGGGRRELLSCAGARPKEWQRTGEAVESREQRRTLAGGCEAGLGRG